MCTSKSLGLRAAGSLFLFLACAGLVGCGSMKAGQKEWIRPTTETPRAGTVYLVRGWVGLFSVGIDRLADQIRENGVTAHVYQHDQGQDLAKWMAEQLKGAQEHEPICLIGHSFGSDDALMIARELDKVGVKVDLIVTLDPVDETTVPKNVKLCYNYWMPGIFGNGNFLRGIPLKQEDGAIGQLNNINLNEDGRELKDTLTNHINIDEAPKLHQRIVEHILATCPERATWHASHSLKDVTASSAQPTPEGATSPANRVVGSSQTSGGPSAR